MKLKTIVLLMVVTIAPATIASEQEPPLRQSQPVGDVITDLESYIPQRMHEGGIPGLSIALIREGRMIWAKGFGLANAFTGRPATMQTAYEVASISKAVTAYIALRLVERGILSLDEPLTSHLDKPWLPPSEYGGQITLRHLASYSSGLRSNNGSFFTVDRSVAFRPGSSFHYSGIGFMYMQDAIEQVTGRSLENNARELVFGPLDMSSSSFTNSPALETHMANGHIDSGIPLLLFMIPFAAILVGIGLIGIVGLRILTGKWKLTWGMTVAACVLAATIVVVMSALSPLGEALPNLVLLAGLCGLVFVAAFTVVFFVGCRVSTQYLAAWHGPVFRVSWGVLSVVLLLWLARLITVPVPIGLSPLPSAVGSLRASAPDLAAVLIELALPQYMNKELAAQIRTPQASITYDMSWGLGLGLQHGEHGDALWHNGQTPGFRSLMVIYPEYGMGVVVLTNSDAGLPVVCDVVQRALGGSVVSSVLAFLR
jgi:CubicO group peptidase (beta-lactamase class C family)